MIACHSGENTANGQNAAVFGSPGTYPSNATGGAISGSPARPTKPSASGGPSISTTSGPSSASASRNDRADPGPWCRTPYSSITIITPNGTWYLRLHPATSRQAR